MPSFSWRADTILFHILCYMIIILHCSNRHFHLTISPATYLALQRGLSFFTLPVSGQTSRQRLSEALDVTVAGAAAHHRARPAEGGAEDRGERTTSVFSPTTTQRAVKVTRVFALLQLQLEVALLRGELQTDQERLRRHTDQLQVLQEKDRQRKGQRSANRQKVCICCVHSLIYRGCVSSFVFELKTCIPSGACSAGGAAPEGGEDEDEVWGHGETDSLTARRPAGANAASAAKGDHKQTRCGR